MICLSGIYGGAVEGGEEDARRMLKPTFSRFEYHLYKVLGQLR
jgi:anaphase-promoting complex subunit 2